jgi:tetratricopeptide (TPR) repeat protein
MPRLLLVFCVILFSAATCAADTVTDLNAAIKALERGQTDTAKSLLANVIQDTQTGTEHKAMAYYIYSLAEKDPNESILYCRKAAELAPGNARYHEKLGILYYQVKAYENAVISLNNVITIMPINAGAYSLRGLAYRDMGNLEKALPDLDKAISLDPSNDIFYARRGVARFQANQHDGALEDLTRATERNRLPRPTQANCYFYAAKIYLEKHQYAEAKRLFAAAQRNLDTEEKRLEAQKLLEQISRAEKWS